jgi:hypothetical protein
MNFRDTVGKPLFLFRRTGADNFSEEAFLLTGKNAAVAFFI